MEASIAKVKEEFPERYSRTSQIAAQLFWEKFASRQFAGLHRPSVYALIGSPVSGPFVGKMKNKTNTFSPVVRFRLFTFRPRNVGLFVSLSNTAQQQ